MISTSDWIETRRRQRQPQIFERLVPVFRQRAQRAAQRVAVGLKTQFDGLAFEARVEGLRIEIAGALVEQRSDQVRRTDLARRILRGAAGEGEVDGDHRNRRLVHQPGFDAARADDALDRGGERRCGEKRKREQ